MDLNEAGDFEYLSSRFSTKNLMRWGAWDLKFLMDRRGSKRQVDQVSWKEEGGIKGLESFETRNLNGEIYRGSK